MKKEINVKNLIIGEAYTNYYYNNKIIFRRKDPIITYWDDEDQRDYIIYAGNFPLSKPIQIYR